MWEISVSLDPNFATTREEFLVRGSQISHEDALLSNFLQKIFAKLPHVPFFFSAFLNKSFYSLLLLDHENEKKIFSSPPSSFKKQIRLRLRREKKDGDGKFSQFEKKGQTPFFPYSIGETSFHSDLNA